MGDANSLCRHPRYYDIVFRRSVAPEIDFPVDLFHTQVGHPLRSLIELGCGPGYHARLCAAWLCGEWLDRSEEMIRFTRQEAEKEGAAVEWIVGDMRDFQLPTPVDPRL
jgi:SAM-dependent methyltransferase